MRKRFLSKFFAGVAIICSLQVCVFGTVDFQCDHEYDCMDRYSYTYSSVSDTHHSKDTFEAVMCCYCGDFYWSYRSTEIESHGYVEEDLFYYNEDCRRSFCPQCGHQFQIWAVNP